MKLFKEINIIKDSISHKLSTILFDIDIAI